MWDLRLANLPCRKRMAKKSAAYKSPMFRNMKIEKGKIRVYFDNADNGLVSKDGHA